MSSEHNLIDHEQQEREAAIARGIARGAEPDRQLCAPEVHGLQPELIYTLVAENVRDYAIFLMDAEGVIRCWGESARLMKWWTRQQAEGGHLRMLYPSGGSEDGTAEQHLRTAAETGEYNGEGHRVRSDGSTFWAYVTLTALRDVDGTLVGFSKVTRDFTARRAVEASLRARVNNTLIASVSHELRTPLNAILGTVSLLEAGVGGSAQQPAHLERLKRNAAHLQQIVNDVLDWSRADAGSLSVSPSAHRLGRAVQEALADVDAQAAAARVTLIDATSGAVADLPYVGDEARVRQILVNLLTNAVKFTAAGGHATISGGTAESVADVQLTGPGPWVYVRVEDTGRGIPADRLGTIFEPYRQSDASDHRRGSGLGLSISRQLARLMGGDVGVRSEPGAGSAFTLWLPMAAGGDVPR